MMPLTNHYCTDGPRLVHSEHNTTLSMVHQNSPNFCSMRTSINTLVVQSIYSCVSYLHPVVESPDVLPDALAADAGVALHIHEVSQGENHLI